MNGKGIVSGGQRGVENHEIGGIMGKNADQKTHDGDNLAKLNDAKCPIPPRFLLKGRLENKKK